MNEFLKVIDFHVLSDNEQIEINGINYTFFDINAKSTKQYGFECFLNGKRLVFLGDETMNPILNERVRGADYVMHEAFCLDSEENIFHAYQKNHSTVKSASEALNQLDVKNIILYHTEESHEDQRKKLYIQEAKENFDGNVIVPNDLEIIEIN
ncbi:MAG: MBL fold metallo-hydrolase [Clostridia bacterium]|nr:MBL fold metallo-hydrolase [Clostridia bacterium]